MVGSKEEKLEFHTFNQMSFAMTSSELVRAGELVSESGVSAKQELTVMYFTNSLTVTVKDVGIVY